MNSHAGNDSSGYEGVHRGHGFGSRNDEGNRLLEMAESLDLFIDNTCFDKMEEHLITYRSEPYICKSN